MPEQQKVARQWLQRSASEDRLFMTDDEHVLWEALKDLPPSCRFVRQHIVGNYIADFACPARRVIVEMAGKYHFLGEQPVTDAQRTADLNAAGYAVVKVTPEEVSAGPRLLARQLKTIINRMEISYPSQRAAKSTSAPTGHSTAPSVSPMSSVANGQMASASQATSMSTGGLQLPPEVTSNAWAVDAACSGNPGPMEYQGIDLATGRQVFHYGPVHGTNNIGEFLAIVHALALWDKQGITGKTLYSDSYTAICWIKKKQCRTKLEHNEKTEQLHQVIARAEQWLRTHPVRVPILQWDTRRWGDIPADFGRK